MCGRYFIDLEGRAIEMTKIIERGLELIKVGDAVQAARKEGWEPVGRKRDTIHLNRAGEALQARVWLKALFGVEKVGAN